MIIYKGGGGGMFGRGYQPYGPYGANEQYGSYPEYPAYGPHPQNQFGNNGGIILYFHYLRHKNTCYF